MPEFYVDGDRLEILGACHLMTTGTEEELIAFAKSVGLKPEWIQRSGTEYVHFDIMSERLLIAAVKAGARRVPSGILIKRCVWAKRKAQ